MKEIEELADGAYFSLRYEIVKMTGNRDKENPLLEQRCEGYIDNYGWFSAPSWVTVIEKIKNKLDLIDLEDVDIDNIR